LQHFFDDARGLAFLGHIALDQEALDADFADFIGRDVRLFDVGAEVQRNMAPRRASSSAMARPIPREDPVTSGDPAGEGSRLVAISHLQYCHFKTPVFRT